MFSSKVAATRRTVSITTVLFVALLSVIGLGFSATAATEGTQLYVWGDDSDGQLGIGVGQAQLIPVLGPDLPNVSSLSAGNGHVCAVSDGKAYCWGNNGDGNLGDGTLDPSPVPLAVGGILANTTVSSISAGDGVSCAVAAGKAYCWGSGSRGQLGNNATVQSGSPVQVAGLTKVTQVSAGRDHACAIDDGKVSCWGYNDNGQLGDNGTGNNSIPTPTSDWGSLAGLTVTRVDVGSESSCAIAGGEVHCWGNNTSGQLGNGNTTRSLAPVKIAGLSDVTSLDITERHACAIASGTVYCWGENSDGQLGDGTTTNRSLPVAVSGALSGAVGTAVTAGRDHSCAISGEVSYCWGYNDAGRLGDGTETDALSPVVVSGLSGANFITAGGYHTLAIASVMIEEDSGDSESDADLPETGSPVGLWFGALGAATLIVGANILGRRVS